MTFVDPRLAIASHRGAAARVLSRRNDGKLSWRRTVSINVKKSEMRICRLDIEICNIWLDVLRYLQFSTMDFVYPAWTAPLKLRSVVRL